MVYTICYGNLKVFQSKEAAIDFYQTGYELCEGCEKERYANILLDLRYSNIGLDGEDEFISTISFIDDYNKCYIKTKLEKPLHYKTAIEKTKEIYDNFIEEQYQIMKKWVFKATEEELKEHYNWYKVAAGDKEGLLNVMFESYCDSYDNFELKERIKEFEVYI